MWTSPWFATLSSPLSLSPSLPFLTASLPPCCPWQDEMAMMTGNVHRDIREAEWRSKRVFFMTGETVNMDISMHGKLVQGVANVIPYEGVPSQASALWTTSCVWWWMRLIEPLDSIRTSLWCTRCLPPPPHNGAQSNRNEWLCCSLSPHMRDECMSV